jgi:hypothetical protein
MSFPKKGKFFPDRNGYTDRDESQDSVGFPRSLLRCAAHWGPLVPG